MTAGHFELLANLC